jgi:hypothetical protein
VLLELKEEIMNVVPRAVRVLAVLGAVSWIGGDAFLVKKNILRPTARTQSTTVRAKEGATDTDGIGSPKAMFFGTVAEKSSVASQSEAKEQRRVLGSQELLMLPRQYGPNADVRFPQMNHVSCTVLSATPSEEIMRQAIDAAIQAHPLLYCRVEGDGEPDERIDLFKMVRKGDPNPCTFVSTPGSISVDDVLTVVNVDGSDSAAFEKSWSGGFARNLDDGSWCHTEKGPLWKIEWHRTHGGGDGPCALILAFNHAISDQSSANKLTDQIIRNAADLEEKGATKPAVKHIIPLAVEDSVMGKEQRWNDVQTDGLSLQTAGYVAGKASEGFKSPVILPDTEVKKDAGNPLGALSIISGQAAGGEDEESDKRRSTLQFRSLSTEATTALLERCREKKISVTNALTAAVTLTSTDFIDNGTETKQRRNYKVLQSLDMRRFGEQLDGGDTVACMAGSMDLLHGPLPDRSGQKLRRNPTKESLVDFWNLAGEGKKQTEDFIASDGPQNAVRVFDFAMSISDMNNLVHLTSQSKDSKGRAYSAGVTNVGVFDRQPAFQREGESEQTPLKVMHGRFKVEDIFFATSHARTGCLYQVSCLTVGGELKMTFHPASPIISEETNARFANAFVDLLEIVAGVKDASSEEDIDDQMNSAPPLSENALPIATAVVGAAAVASHAQAYSAFFSSVMQMKDNIADPSDFWGALNFWVFFAVGHPILEPILAISDVLHGSPGPKVADLVPVTFLLGNLIVLGTIALSKEVSYIFRLIPGTLFVRVHQTYQPSILTMSFLFSLFLRYELQSTLLPSLYSLPTLARDLMGQPGLATLTSP